MEQYIMEYIKDIKGGRKQHVINANTLKEAEAKAKALAKNSRNFGTIISIKPIQ